MDERMVPRHRDIFRDANVTIGTASYLDTFLADLASRCGQTFGVNNVEHFFLIILQTLKNDEVFRRFIHVDDIHDLVFVRYLEGQDLLANLAVDLVELEHDLPSMDFPRPFSFKPAT